jgi:hypothetical protein
VFVIEFPAGSEAFRPASEADPSDLAAVAAVLAATVEKVGTSGSAVSPAGLLEALVLLRRAQNELAGIEPTLIAAARAAGVSWQALAPALGVASRQAAERRYLRSVSAPTEQPDATRDARVQAERDRRAGQRAVIRWANDNTADLRRLAGQITALTDLDADADDTRARLHDALGDPDASALPDLLAAIQRHLPHHRGLTDEIDTVTARTEQIRQQSPRQRGDTSRGPGARSGDDERPPP